MLGTARFETEDSSARRGLFLFQINDMPQKAPDKPGPGRPKGSKNKITNDIKAMVLGALEALGGQEYMEQQARENPNAFMALVGKILPTQITGANDGPVQVDARYSGLPPHILEMIGKK